MKKIIFTLAILSIAASPAIAQPLLKQAPSGFDSLRSAIPHGKIDTISYSIQLSRDKPESHHLYTAGIFE